MTREDRELGTAGGAMPYRIYAPAQAAGPLPLLLFLHGAGERGRDLDQMARTLPARLERGDDLPFLVVAPQCPAGRWWTELVPALSELLDVGLGDPRVDRGRAYVTGLSMGGYGTWALGAVRAEALAALAPICGGGGAVLRDRAALARLAALPIWNFHGAADDVVPLAESEAVVAAVRRAGGDVRHTVYPGVQHDSWTRTYDDPALYAWLLQHRR